MLNNDELYKFLGQDFPLKKITDIHWRAQDSNDSSVLFYKVTSDVRGEELFRDRISSTKFKWLIINRSLSNLPDNVCVLDEKLWPEVQKLILDELYPLPALKMIGITGTNGKTTTTDLVLQLGHQIGKKGLSIGTLGVREYNHTILDFGMTSPGFIDLRKFLCRYGKDKDFCVMEASSHALLQDRLHGISFDAAGWLSFSQDHLDYHKSMEEYFSAKCLIFNKLSIGAKLFAPIEQASLIQKLQQVSKLVVSAAEITEDLPLFFQTRFNKNNLEVAQAVIHEIYPEASVIDYKTLMAPDGRFYIRPYNSNFIIVDFAHTPDALENICHGIRETFPEHKLKVLFGCGGDRDRSKRPKMAEVVARWADEIYVTSDNPRSEDPEQIIHDIVAGLKDKKYKTITERPAAVQVAFQELKNKEVLLLAGKGHEDYILINGIKHPYSDIQEVDAFIARTKV